MENIETSRLLIRPLTLEDKNGDVPYMSLHRIPGYVEDDGKYGFGCMVVHLADTGTVIGQVGLQLKIWENAVIGLSHRCAPEHDILDRGDDGANIAAISAINGDAQLTAINSVVVDMYWFLAQDYWGKGYAHEAASALIDHSFHNLKLDRLTAHIGASNERSLALARRLGFSLASLPYAPGLVRGLLFNPLGESQHNP